MSATLAENSKQNFAENTAETAEEVTMEMNDAIETEQPRSSTPPVPTEPKHVVTDQAGSDGALSTSGKSGSAFEGDEGSSVDDVPGSGPLSDDKAPSIDDVPGSGPLCDGKVPSIDDSGSGESSAVVSGSVDNVGESAQPGSEKETISSEQQNANEASRKPFKHSNVKLVDVESFNTLSNLAEQIDDFDPISMITGALVARPEPEEKLFSENIKSLIDNIVQDGNNVVHLSDKEHVPEKVSDDEDVEGIIDLSEQELTLSAGLDGDDDLEEQQNGNMSASTESEGFTEDNKVETTTEETEEKPIILEDEPIIPATENEVNVKVEQSDVKKDVSKIENASPTKTTKTKRKEDKSIEHILKALSSLQTTEEKLAALCKKYADLHEEHRAVQGTLKQSQRKLTVISREKDQLQTEHTKAVMAKSKLESLCRELQKHNQTIRQDSLQRAKEEDEKRKEISQKFQTTIGEIQSQMQDNHDRNKQLREENCELANKLKKFIEQYEQREKHLEKILQHRELEKKLSEAKLEQASAILLEEKSRSQKENELLIMQTTECMKKMQLKDTELKMYKDRYEEFQLTINKSEEMFQKFKSEMDKMTKRCKKLEKEGAQWRGKWENANKALLEMAGEKTRYDGEKPVLLNKISKLESLCRAMQAERQARKLLETEGVDLSKLGKMSESIIKVVDSDRCSQVKDIPTPDEYPRITAPLGAVGGDIDANSVADSQQSGETEKSDITVIPSDKSEHTRDTNESEGASAAPNRSDSPQEADSSSSDEDSDEVATNDDKSAANGQEPAS